MVDDIIDISYLLTGMNLRIDKLLKRNLRSMHPGYARTELSFVSTSYTSFSRVQQCNRYSNRIIYNRIMYAFIDQHIQVTSLHGYKKQLCYTSYNESFM